MAKKRMGRPSIVDAGSSRNIFLPARHIAYVEKLASDTLSFSAAVRVIIEAHYRANGGVVGDLR